MPEQLRDAVLTPFAKVLIGPHALAQHLPSPHRKALWEAVFPLAAQFQMPTDCKASCHDCQLFLENLRTRRDRNINGSASARRRRVWAMLVQHLPVESHRGLCGPLASRHSKGYHICL